MNVNTQEKIQGIVDQLRLDNIGLDDILNFLQPDIKDKLKHLLSQKRETLKVDFKYSLSTNDRDELIKDCVALANTLDSEWSPPKGVLVLGVVDPRVSTPPPSVKPFNAQDPPKEDWGEWLQKIVNDGTDPRLNVSYDTLETNVGADNVTYGLFIIDEPSELPVFVSSGKHKGIAYRRYNRTKPLTAPMTRREILESLSSKNGASIQSGFFDDNADFRINALKDLARSYKDKPDMQRIFFDQLLIGYLYDPDLSVVLSTLEIAANLVVSQTSDDKTHGQVNSHLLSTIYFLCTPDQQIKSYGLQLVDRCIKTLEVIGDSSLDSKLQELPELYRLGDFETTDREKDISALRDWVAKAIEVIRSRVPTTSTDSETSDDA